MKYGLLIDFGLENCNFGDYAQTIAIEYLYEKMGISSHDIVYLTHKELSTYDGESLILPYSYVLGYIMNPYTEHVMLSNKIIPLFLGVSIGVGYTRTLDAFKNPENGWIGLFQNASPIGCRDEATRCFFEDLGIPAYLQGCITNILPQRSEGNYHKVLLVDCPSDVLPFIPKRYIEHAEVLSNAENRDNLSIYDNYIKIKQRYCYYRDNASLIVTSRYHVATPCNAMGIPSILIMRPFKGKAKDIRLDSLNPGIQLVGRNEYADIDWSPRINSYPELKSAIFAIASSRIATAEQMHTNRTIIRKCFQKRIEEYATLNPDDSNLWESLKQFIVNKYATCSSGGFYIWAASNLLCENGKIPLCEMIKKVNSNLKFHGWIDTYKSGTLCDFPIFKPSEIHLYQDEFIIVATGTVIPFALKFFKTISLKKDQYHIFFDEMIQESDLRQVALN